MNSRGPENQPDRVPIVFVYLGNPLPPYAIANLNLLATHYLGPIHVVLSEPAHGLPKGVVSHQIGEWYSGEKFARFRANSTVDQLFREGFWLHAAERLFVVADFAKKMRFERFFHAELDVLICDLNDFARFLDAHGRGVFCPPEGPDRALASLVYCNSLTAFDSLLEFLINHASIGNEMKLLGHFLKERPGDGHALASDRIFDPDWPFGLSSVSGDMGLVDSSGFGQWLFGPDPRNLIGTAWNRYQSRGLRFQMRSLVFSYSLISNQFAVQGPSRETYRIRAIHVHSKVFTLIKHPLLLWLLHSLLRIRIKFPVKISFDSWWDFLAERLYSRTGVKRFLKLPKYSHAVLETLLIAAADFSPRVLSERKLGALNSIQPVKKKPKDMNLGAQVFFDEITGAFPKSRFSATLKPLNLDAHTLLQLDLMYWGLTSGKTALLHRDPPPVALEREAWGASGATPLFLSETKHYESTRLAVNVWPQLFSSRQWSFNENIQLISSGFVSEMFKDDVLEIIYWLKTGVENQVSPISALHTYALWVRTHKRARIVGLRGNHLAAGRPIPPQERLFS